MSGYIVVRLNRVQHEHVLLDFLATKKLSGKSMPDFYWAEDEQSVLIPYESGHEGLSRIELFGKVLADNGLSEDRMSTHAG
jgi:hypothetical protein